MEKNANKLVLNKETLRDLTARNAAEVKGGTWRTASCYGTCRTLYCHGKTHNKKCWG